MSILHEMQLKEARWRRERNRLIIRSLFMLTSIVPAILIAWNFDKSRQFAIRALQGDRPTVVTEPQPVQIIQPAPTPAPVVTPVPAIPEDHGFEIRRINHTPNPIFETESKSEERTFRNAPVDNTEVYPESPRKYAVALDLENKQQRFPIDLQEGDAVLRLLPFTGANVVAELSPEHGKIDAHHRATVEFKGPRKAWIDVSVRHDDGRSMIILEYTVQSDAGRVPFTTTYLKRARSKVAKSLQQLQATLVRMQNEKRQIKIWLKLPAPKLLWKKKEAEARLTELDAYLPDVEKQRDALTAELKVIDELLQLAKTLHGVVLQFVHAE